MAYNMILLYHLTGENTFEKLAERQIRFMSHEAKEYPTGYAMFLVALSDYLDMPDKITIVAKEKNDLKDLSCKIPLNMVIKVLDEPAKEYPYVNDQTTFYVCKGRACQSPVNDLII